MIKLSELRESDRGRMVIYRSQGGDKVERGRISSWNECWMFVEYDGPYRGAAMYTAPTRPEDLEWLEDFVQSEEGE